MAVDNGILSYNNDATFSGNSTAWYITCTKGGTIKAKVDMYVDVFIVGGGGGGSGGVQGWWGSGGGGGGGGYRVTKKGIYLKAGSTATVTIGSGGKAGADGGSSTALGYTAAGGKAGKAGTSGAGAGGAGGANGGSGSYIDGHVSYSSSTAGGDGGYAFDESSWSSTKYGAGGGGGSAVTDASNSYGDWINGYYGTRNSGANAPGGANGGGSGGGRNTNGGNASNYGGGGGGGGSNASGGAGYQGLVIIRNARGGYKLTINQATGSTITVQRTSSSSSNNTTLLNGAFIYANDVLKVTFAAQANYEILTHTVNGSNFTSGSSHTVTGNTTVATTARPLASDVGATDANIGSVSTITVTKHSTSYYHSLQYSFGGLTGYITSSGGVSSTEVKYSSTSIAFTVPTTFYAKIPNAKTGTCTITCRTYATSSSTTTLGDAKTCTFTVTAAEANCSPTVSGTVVDTNATTVALTGDANILVRYKSTATCTISATARQSATITSKKIQNQTPNSNDVLTVSGDSLSTGSFSFSATCSRGYTSSVTVSKTLVAYIKLTLNPVVYRPAPTSGEIALTLSGNYYGGSFGAYSNTLTIRYRYRETTVSTWSSWITVAANKYSKTSRAYSTSNPILLADSNGNTTGFDYQKSYYFQIQAYDGANGTTLTSVSSTVTVQRGIPVFDWGESDFNFNVPVKIDGVSLIDIFYPVGSVYMTTNASLPSPLSSYGTWASVSTGISGVNGWKRTA